MRIRAYHPASGNVLTGEVTDYLQEKAPVRPSYRIIPDGLLESVVIRGEVWYVTELTEWLDRTEAAPEAEESIRALVAAALWDAECEQPCTWGEADRWQQADYYRLADAAIAVLRGPSVAEEALRRVEELCQRWEREAWGSDIDYWPQCTRALRAALNGGER